MTTATTTVHRAEATTTSADTADVNFTNAGNDSGSTVLPEPAALGLCDGSIAELAILLTKADEQDRTASRQIEDVADSAATKDENDRVAQMRAKADADESQAWAKGVGDIVGGALSIAGGAAGWSTSRSDAASKGASGIGEIVAGQYRGNADRDDAGAAKADAQAQAEIRTFNRAHDSELAANASMQKVEQFLDQVQQTRNATILTAATFRA